MRLGGWKNLEVDTCCSLKLASRASGSVQTKQTKQQFCKILKKLCVIQIQIQYSTIQYSAVQCSAMQCNAVQCSAVECSAVQCSAVQCSAVQCSAV